MINEAGKIAGGETLIFLEKNLAPLKGWLSCLDRAFSKHGNNKLFGARICDQNGKIASAGIVIDHNNAPVCAYPHLNMDFPGVLKQRSFQMVDHMVALKKKLFLTSGGFTPDAGGYWMMDLCLKTLQSTNDGDTVIYLPDLKMIFLGPVPAKTKTDDAVYFYGKWTGHLWESEKKLLQEDKISQQDLAHAKMAAAMQSAG
jgi:hypothetical protein